MAHTDLGRQLLVGEGFRLAAVDPASTPGFDGSKGEATGVFSDHDKELDDLQERLFALGRSGDLRRVLLVLQGMDTSGKGGIIQHVCGKVDPQGVQIASFKAPTAEEREHDFLWRIRPRLPGAGMIGVFDRSHYEDVLIHRVRSLSAPEEIERRYGAIVDFERELAAAGTTIIKVMLHISRDEQKKRLAARLANPAKHWKYNLGDIDEREYWDEYMAAYETALSRTSTEAGPWYVIPADRKWYARLAVQRLLLDALRGMDLGWPLADFDVEAEKARLALT